MNEGLKAAVIEAIRIFASVLVFFLAWQGLALLAGETSAVTFFIVGAVCGVLTYREFPSYLKNLIERMKKDGRS